MRQSLNALSMTTSKWLALSGWLAAAALGAILLARPAPQALTVGEARQDVSLAPLPIAMTNEPIILWQYANEYRAAPGWIAASNDRIYAGLADRAWSAPYALPSYRHEISVYAGSGLGVGYTYLIGGRLPIGGALMYAGGEVQAFASAGWRW